MINSYGLFNHHLDNNTLVILFSDKPITKKTNQGEVELLYSEQELVGYSISNFIRYAKIKYSGIIFLPSKPLIDVINIILKNNKLEELEYKKESGYIVKDQKVFAKQGTFLRDETISRGRYCSYFDLYIDKENDQELITIDEDIRDNIDFFQMEEK